jgi:hypothetical protein
MTRPLIPNSKTFQFSAKLVCRRPLGRELNICPFSAFLQEPLLGMSDCEDTRCFAAKQPV